MMNAHLNCLLTNLVALNVFPKTGDTMGDLMNYMYSHRTLPQEWQGTKLGDDQLCMLENLWNIHRDLDRD